MADEKKESKFYWIKLKTDFFAENTPIDALMGMGQPNGSEYVALYLKLCLMTANTNGRLFNQIGEIIVPYSIDKIVRDAKFFSRDTVVVALELYKQLGLVYEESNGMLTISNYNTLVGSETAAAERMRKMREKRNNVTPELQNSSSQSYLEIRDKSIENRDKEIKNSEGRVSEENITSCSVPEQEARSEPPVITMMLNSGEEYPFYQSDIDEFQSLYPAVDVSQQMRTMKGWCLTNPTKRKTKRGIRKFVNSWLAKEQDRFHPGTNTRVQNRVSEVDSWG